MTIRTRKAYSSVSNKSARWPALNVTDVTNQKLNNTAHEDNYEVLMLSAPTVDITNLDTAKVKASDNIEFYKQEIVISTKNMMTVAENAIGSNPKL